jgi:hypothetical protein
MWYLISTTQVVVHPAHREHCFLKSLSLQVSKAALTPTRFLIHPGSYAQYSVLMNDDDKLSITTAALQSQAPRLWGKILQGTEEAALNNERKA